MKVIEATNVAHAWAEACRMVATRDSRIQELELVGTPSRVGQVLVAPHPVTTVYLRPWERVLMDPVRDANPIFHLMEALWMLAGRDDATWLDQFVGDFSKRFAEDGGRMHGAYGKRWRDWFTRNPRPREEDPDGQYEEYVDQLDAVVALLRANPYDRQAVIQMWDAEADLGVPGLKDRPCNTQIYLRADRVKRVPLRTAGERRSAQFNEHRVLDMTVTCRSNDIVFGCYGANAVHFSVLQEYLAARMGYAVGTYTQMSNNWHVYERDLPKMDYRAASANRDQPYPGYRPLVTVPQTFDAELREFFRITSLKDPLEPPYAPENTFLSETAVPMWTANRLRKAGLLPAAIKIAETIDAPDWRMATLAWLQRRVKP